MNGICYKWPGRGFGNVLILAHVVKILVDNGLSAVLKNHRRVDGLVDVPIYDPDIHKDYLIYVGRTPNTTYVKNIDLPFILQHLSLAEEIFKRKIYFDKEKHNHVPVKYHEIDSIPAVDVVMCTTTSNWSPYRNWPYFEELKTKLGTLKITYKDLNKDGVFNIECLNYVKKCKIYLGLETGTSHYVSKFANGKGLIIQSGFCPFYVWAFPYEYIPITANVQCELRPCFLDRDRMAEKMECLKDSSCMKNISVEMVLTKILERL